MTGMRLLVPEVFDTQEQLHEYIISIKTGVLPLKLSYLGSVAAKAHDRLVRSTEYKLGGIELDLIRSVFEESILSVLDGKGINIFDVGSGNGLKACAILEHVLRKFEHIQYCGLDYSQELLSIATNNVAGFSSDITVKTACVDIESGSFRETIEKLHSLEPNHTNLFLLLGHTLGNPLDRLGMLKNIRMSMAKGDNLLVGIELYSANRENEIISHYENEVFLSSIFNVLSFAGIRSTDGDLETVFNHKGKDVEVYFRINNQLSIYHDQVEVVRFEPGEKLLVFVSHRFQEAELNELFASSGLGMVKKLYDKEQTYSLMFATAV